MAKKSESPVKRSSLELRSSKKSGSKTGVVTINQQRSRAKNAMDNVRKYSQVVDLETTLAIASVRQYLHKT